MRLAVAALLAAGFLGALVYATLGESRVECEVCMDFGGTGTCRTVSAADRDRAVSMGVANACAILSAGVTQGIRCQRTPPRSVRCSE